MSFLIPKHKVFEMSFKHLFNNASLLPLLSYYTNSLTFMKSKLSSSNYSRNNTSFKIISNHLSYSYLTQKYDEKEVLSNLNHYTMLRIKCCDIFHKDILQDQNFDRIIFEEIEKLFYNLNTYNIDSRMSILTFINSYLNRHSKTLATLKFQNDFNNTLESLYYEVIETKKICYLSKFLCILQTNLNQDFNQELFISIYEFIISNKIIDYKIMHKYFHNEKKLYLEFKISKQLFNFMLGNYSSFPLNNVNDFISFWKLVVRKAFKNIKNIKTQHDIVVYFIKKVLDKRDLKIENTLYLLSLVYQDNYILSDEDLEIKNRICEFLNEDRVSSLEVNNKYARQIQIIVKKTL